MSLGERCELVMTGVDETCASLPVIHEVLAKVLRCDLAEVTLPTLSDPIKVPGALSQDDARRLSDALQSFGIQCHIKLDDVGVSGLTLAPLEGESEPRIKVFDCPDCGHSIDFLVGKPEPEKCPSCGLVFSKHEYQVKEKAICERVVRRLRESADSDQETGLNDREAKNPDD